MCQSVLSSFILLDFDTYTQTLKAEVDHCSSAVKIINTPVHTTETTLEFSVLLKDTSACEKQVAGIKPAVKSPAAI